MEGYTHLPLIGDKAPEFECETTNGPLKFPADYKGKWVILFSHPADFTPVCTTEFMTFGSRSDELKALNCELIGLSVDSLSAHIAWLRRIKDIEWNGIKGLDIKFPVIDDIKMDVAKKYGMIQPNQSDTKAVRAVFFIDPNGIIRCIHYYPLSTGRNFDEMLRVILALQKSDSDKVSTPAGWTPGKDVIVPAKMTMDDVNERVNNPCDLKVIDWFLSLRKDKC
jgi:Peroxiredoxin